MKKTVKVLNYRELLGELAEYALSIRKELFETIRDEESEYCIEEEVFRYIVNEGKKFGCFVVSEDIAKFLDLDFKEYRYYFYFKLKDRNTL